MGALVRPRSTRFTHTGRLEPKPLRPADEPTEYERAVAQLGPEALAAWVRLNHRRRYVPEPVLRQLGLEGDEPRWYAVD
jgi:hypothetical protein